MFMEYGNDEIKTLATQFEGVVADSTECLEEWSSFKQFLQENCSNIKHREVSYVVICHGHTYIPTRVLLLKFIE